MSEAPKSTRRIQISLVAILLFIATIGVGMALGSAGFQVLAIFGAFPFAVGVLVGQSARHAAWGPFLSAVSMSFLLVLYLLVFESGENVSGEEMFFISLAVALIVTPPAFLVCVGPALAGYFLSRHFSRQPISENLGLD